MNIWTSQKQKRHEWMREVENLVTDALPELAGKMDWDTAQYLYLIGDSPTGAAMKLVGGKWLGLDARRGRR
jgi:hypothetical protein